MPQAEHPGCGTPGPCCHPCLSPPGSDPSQLLRGAIRSNLAGFWKPGLQRQRSLGAAALGRERTGC